MKYKNVINLLGAIAFIVGVSSNMHYALSDYGIVNNSLHNEVLAQSSSSSGGGGTMGGDNQYSSDKRDCLYKGTASPFEAVVLAPGVVAFANYKGEWQHKEIYGDVRCISGGSNPCVPKKCPDYPGKTT